MMMFASDNNRKTTAVSIELYDALAQFDAQRFTRMSPSSFGRVFLAVGVVSLGHDFVR